MYNLLYQNKSFAAIFLRNNFHRMVVLSKESVKHKIIFNNKSRVGVYKKFWEE